MHGSEVRTMILASGLRLWEVAEAYGVSDSQFSRLLRHEFSPNDVDRIQIIIDSLSKKKKKP